MCEHSATVNSAIQVPFPLHHWYCFNLQKRPPEFKKKKKKKKVIHALSFKRFHCSVHPWRQSRCFIVHFLCCLFTLRYLQYKQPKRAKDKSGALLAARPVRCLICPCRFYLRHKKKLQIMCNEERVKAGLIKNTNHMSFQVNSLSNNGFLVMCKFTQQANDLLTGKKKKWTKINKTFPHKIPGLPSTTKCMWDTCTKSGVHGEVYGACV